MNREVKMKTEVETILARSAAYRLLSVGFAHPAPEILTLFRDGFARQLAEAVSRLSGDEITELAAAVEELHGAVTDLDGIEGEYNRLFRTQLACTPYESEYDPLRSVRKGQTLADILGFYAAFGLSPSQAEKEKELPDHIGVELEFMSLLLQKEAYARLHDWGEKVEICTDAQRKFLNDHLGTWVFTFCDRLAETAGLEFYRSLAVTLRRFLEREIRALGLAPAQHAGRHGSSEEGTLTCPFAPASPEG